MKTKYKWLTVYLTPGVFLFVILYLLFSESQDTLNMFKWEEGLVFMYLLLSTIFSALGWGIIKE